MTWRAVTDKQWNVIAATTPPTATARGGGGRASVTGQCFEGILWIVWTGAPWSELPSRYGSKAAVHSRLSEWAPSGVLLALARFS